MTLSTGQRLGPYEILGLVGAGGMGQVYRARDTRLDRDVAVKVLPESVAADSRALARFEREAKAVAALSHPNILAIHDVGSEGGISYAVMELLEGETVRAKLAAGPLPSKRAVDYALQIARGLSAAHERGIVHRDLKPENLFVTKDGHVKILDFGLARKVEAADTARSEETGAPTASGITEPGTVMGTAGYMSPEQVKGLPVDHRSDIFSYGAVLYEMLAGKKAFARLTSNETIAAILKEEPPELSASGASVSPALESIVRHCLVKDRESRFQSVRDIAFTLSEISGATAAGGSEAAAFPASASSSSPSPTPRRSRRGLVAAAVAAAVIVAAAAGVFFRLRSHRAPSAAPGVQRVAVLPFENLGTPEDDYFVDGISDAVRGKLTSVPGIEVIARGSSNAYRKTTKEPKRIADELGARYLLTATVRWQKSGGSSRVQVTPELVEIRDTGAPASKWQQPFDAALTDVFLVQSDIASRVAQALGVALGAGQAKQLSETPTQNLSAYDAFLKGEAASTSLANDDPRRLRAALGYYERAAALDPGFAQAWAQISRVSSRLFEITNPTPELAERARQAAEKAVELAPNRPESHLALGNYRNAVSRDPARALEDYARGRRFEPNNADLLAATAIAEEVLGKWDACIEHFRQAERVDPRSVLTQDRLGEALLWLRRYPEAGAAIERGLSLAPDHLYLIELKAMTFLVQGDLAGARSALHSALKDVEPAALVAHVANYWDLVWVLDEPQRELLLRLTPDAFDGDLGTQQLCFAQAYALKGDTGNMRKSAEEARKGIEEQIRRAPDDPQRHVILGVALAYLGRKDEAIRECERGGALHPVGGDAYTDPYLQHQLARIYVLTGEPERALDQLEPLLKIPYILSPRWLEIDPTFDTLRGNPRFRRLVAAAPAPAAGRKG